MELTSLVLVYLLLIFTSGIAANAAVVGLVVIFASRGSVSVKADVPSIPLPG